MRGLPHRLAAGTSGVLLVSTLGACGGSPRADPSPTPATTSAAATETPTPTPPAMPAAARADTKAGAIAFVRHYVDLINYAGHWRRSSILRRATCYLRVHLPLGHQPDRKGSTAEGGYLRGGKWALEQIAADSAR